MALLSEGEDQINVKGSHEPQYYNDEGNYGSGDMYGNSRSFCEVGYLIFP